MRSIVLMLACVLLASSLPEPADAQLKRRFTEASLQGSFAVVGTGGAHRAASVGTTRYDRRGRVTRSLVLNAPDGEGGRKTTKITATGTATVNADGTGFEKLTNTLPDGSTFTATFDFVITEAKANERSGARIATRLYLVQREPGIAADLVVFDLTRLSD